MRDDPKRTTEEADSLGKIIHEPVVPDDPEKKVEEDGEPFDGNFA